MRIRFVKRADGGAVLRCERPDGSVVWQRQDGRRGRFFPPHDLTHYAVETTLGFRDGFYGLVAEGWEITDFGSPWPRGPVPDGALATEFLVGLFDQERATGVVQSIDDVNLYGSRFFAEHGRSGSWRCVTDDALVRARAVATALIERWQGLAPDEAIEVEF
ncbi:MAG TPA: hypothetical protein VNW46_20275 [Gemmatimonadaceae bacterium]|nr:hypothetical protein [Gemmatimonadaceae bacterium]